MKTSKEPKRGRKSPPQRRQALPPQTPLQSPEIAQTFQNTNSPTKKERNTWTKNFVSNATNPDAAPRRAKTPAQYIRSIRRRPRWQMSNQQKEKEKKLKSPRSRKPQETRRIFPK